MRLLLLGFSFFYLMCSSSAKGLEESDHFNVSLDFEARTSILVSKMTLEEKILHEINKHVDARILSLAPKIISRP